MAENQKTLTVSEVTVDRILSHYLWNTPTPPKREQMSASKTNADRTPVKIDASDYMQNGAGRYASAADFKMFENFFKKNLPARDKPYTFDEIGNLIYGKNFNDPVDGIKAKINRDGFTVSISQYGINPSSADYVERAFIFGSTQVTVTKADIQKLQFVVNPDGSKETRNLRITPVKDNFDFEGGTSAQDWRSQIQKWGIDTVNTAFKATLDPKNIGRPVPIEYANTENLKFINIIHQY